MNAITANPLLARRPAWEDWIQQIQQRWMPKLEACSLPSCITRVQVWTRLRRFRHGIRLEGRWYCSLPCLEVAARRLFAQASIQKVSSAAGVRRRVPLGLLMLSRGLLTSTQLRSALDAQIAAGHGKIGEWLQNLGYSTEDQITGALGVQWACPVFAPARPDFDPQCLSLLPRILQESFRMMPVHYNRASRLLYLGFAERIDYTILHTIERMLDCRALPCVVSPTLLQRSLAGPASRTTEVVFESVAHSQMARTTASYAGRSRTGEVRVAGCGKYVWTRLIGGGGSIDLLFCAGADSEASSERSLSLPRRSTAVTA
jgi:hypothetical protein